MHQPSTDIPAIEAIDLTKRFGAVDAVLGISLAIGRGEVVSLLGPNGSGKTTFMRMLLGLLQPDAGHVRIAGRAAQADRQQVGYAPQRSIVWPDLTGHEQLTFIASMYGLSDAEGRRRTEELLSRLNLTDVAERRAGALSGGMKRRLSLALALIHDPAVLVLDEPEASLDPASRMLVRGLLRDLAREGKAVLVSSHVMAESDRVADRVAIVHDGVLLDLDTPERLKRKHGPDRLLEVSLPHASADRFAEALAGLRQLTDSACAIGNVVILDPDISRERVRQAMRSRGIEPTDMRLRARSLEDVYVRLTAGGGAG